MSIRRLQVNHTFTATASLHLSDQSMADEKNTAIGTNPAKVDSTVNKWSTYMYEIYRTRQPPLLGTVDIHKLEEKARKKMEEQGLIGESLVALPYCSDSQKGARGLHVCVW